MGGGAACWGGLAGAGGLGARGDGRRARGAAPPLCARTPLPQYIYEFCAQYPAPAGPCARLKREARICARPAAPRPVRGPQP